MSEQEQARSVTAVIIFVMVCILLFYAYLRAKNSMALAAAHTVTRSSPHRPFITSARHAITTEVPAPRHALDPAIIKALPVTIFRSGNAEEGGNLQCAVCLCELSDGEAAHVLPGCGHGFHLDCIDAWFRSNDTCPLCRTPVGVIPPAPEVSNSLENGTVDIAWGSTDRVDPAAASAATSVLVIRIHDRSSSGSSLARSTVANEEAEIKSQILRELLSRESDHTIQVPEVVAMSS